MSFRRRLAALAGERLPWPDTVTRRVIAARVDRLAHGLATPSETADAAFAEGMAAFPVAMHADAANRQHYEVPAEFFSLVLGPQRKYSCCLYDGAVDTLAAAEERALSATAGHAALQDGQRILELGCGWGSLSLWMARHYPSASIVSVSNSRSQRDFITREADREGVRNLTVVTADMNDFATDLTFDRVVSVEMFEHMANWRTLLQRVRDLLAPDGRLFLHVFTTEGAPYRFPAGDRSDWIAQHFFTGGMMPSRDLVRQFADLFSLEESWRWPGTHYQRTADDWLVNFDRNQARIRVVLEHAYGREAGLWQRRWRLFFMATAGLFGHAGGNVWDVSHYRLAPVAG